MKNNFFNVIMFASIINSVTVKAAEAPTPSNTLPNTTAPATTSTSTMETPQPAKKPTKVTSFYGYTYRAFTGTGNGGPVVLDTGDMQMHILALKYHFNDRWALRVGSAYIIHTLNFRMAMPKPMEQSVFVEGFTDLRASAQLTALKDDKQSLDFTLGLNLPTSPLLKDPEFHTPLPPQDQFSSGTYDVMATTTYSYNLEQWTFSEKLDAVIHTGVNAIGYRLGDDFGSTTAATFAYRPWLMGTVSARFTDRKPIPVNNMDKSIRADVKQGSGWEGAIAVRSGLPPINGIRIGFEAGAPFYNSSKTNQYTVGKTLWYASTNLTATF